ncbi:protein-methionine-sulfoxide reductase catalytic subunit MsrP [Hwanghaeella sp.]|uniref:protein-methionine-sulfoxide reductase catalytic subunit MsrP n=1 Tax=Hwanghaeella sp. TaxID=2605943 RepID=UPI003CCBB45E
MLIKKRRGWELPERTATPEATFLNRRQLAKGLAAGSILLAGGSLFAGRSNAATEVDPTADLYPVKLNGKYEIDRMLTEPKYALTYNNYYEFGTHKGIAQLAQKLEIRPWTVLIDGMVEKEQMVDVDTLIRAMPLEERLYRHRCVEAWSMTVPWSGFPLAALVDYAKPLSGAKFIRMETVVQEETMPGLRSSWYPWPYVEGLTMAEATNELAFIATGLYGAPIAKQNGAPLRLVTPWKYGFKSIKSLVRFTFTDQRPVGFWEEIQGSEYGFWANVNPEVSHPRWSQAHETVLGTNEKVPTLLFNGYGDYVADLYKGMENERLYM